MTRADMEWFRRNVPEALSQTGGNLPTEMHRKNFEAALEADRKAQRDRVTRCCCTKVWREDDGFNRAFLELDPACPQHSIEIHDLRTGAIWKPAP